MSLLRAVLILFCIHSARSRYFKTVPGCEEDFKLANATTSTSVTSSPLQCAIECLADDICNSVNVCPMMPGSNLLTCEKMDAIIADWSCDKFQPVPGCYFFQKVEPWCQNDGTYNESTETCDCVFGFTGNWCERFYYDCSEAYQKTQQSRGLQNLIIQPLTSPEPFLVHCYLDWGGFTYIRRQQHFCPQLDFNGSWEEMKRTFGNISCNHWLGLEKIHQLTSQATYTLDIFMRGPGGWKGHPLYTEFRVGDEAGGYNFTYDIYEIHGQYPAEDGFGADGANGPNGHPFATYDRPDPGNCVVSQGVSWWYGPACPDYNPHLPLYGDGSAPLYLKWPNGTGTIQLTIFDAQISTTW